MVEVMEKVPIFLIPNQKLFDFHAFGGVRKYPSFSNFLPASAGFVGLENDAVP